MGTIKEHKCKHCGAMTTQDDEQCYKNTNNMGTTNRAEEYACKKYNVKEGLNDYEENHFNSTNVNLAKAFIEGAEYSQSEIDELTKEVERLRKEMELFEKRCVNLSKSTDEILEYLIPFVDNNLDDNDINRIIKWHNDNSNRH